MENKFRN